MQDASYYILISLAAGPRHGYGILQDVAELCGEANALGAGTLYGALERFSDDELIEIERETIERGRPRRYYRLTRKGRKAVQEETERRAALLKVAQKRLRARAT
ncbi:Transcriptional regulator, PadR family protein [Minicystis rosea]|nr:Transcriptional regulator, PadR family protein [Minicystis rosea]